MEHVVDTSFIKRLSLILVVLIAVLGLSNLTTSNISLHVAGDAPSSADVVFGELRPIRSDEWNRATPILLGTFLDDWSDEVLTPFDADEVRFGWVGKSLLPALVYPERVVADILPSRIGFFAWMWFPPIAAIVSVAILLRLCGVGRAASVSGGIVTSLGASSAWWSFHGAQLVWPVALAISLLIIASTARHETRKIGVVTTDQIRRVAFVLLAGLLLARYPMLYAPWAIPTVMIFGGLLLDLTLSQRNRRLAILNLVGSLGVALSIAGLSILSQITRLSTLAGTSYPGSRRYSGGSDGMAAFTGAHSYFAQTDRGSQMNFSNLSEAALGPTVLVVAALFVLWATALTMTNRKVRDQMPIFATAMTGLLFAWMLFEWPSWLLRGNPLTVIPGYRVTQIMGTIAIPLTWLVVARSEAAYSGKKRQLLAVGAGLVVLVLSASNGSFYRAMFPLVDLNEVWLTSILMAACFASFVWKPSGFFSVLPITLFVVASSISVNPIVRGVGDLHDSSAAITIRETIGYDEVRRVASDHVMLDALLAANAVPTLGGQQNWGPDKQEWSRLDPSGKFESAWNRGASSLQFSWTSDVDQSINISTPVPDLISVEIGPCNPTLEFWEVDWLISSQPLESSCTEEAAQFMWAGYQRYVYSISR